MTDQLPPTPAPDGFNALEWVLILGLVGAVVWVSGDRWSIPWREDVRPVQFSAQQHQMLQAGSDGSAPSSARLFSATAPEKRDINQATITELAQVRGIGSALAETIINYRQEYGPFAAMSQLRQVPGIGASRQSLLEVHFYVNSAETNSQKNEGLLSDQHLSYTHNRVPEGVPSGLKIGQSSRLDLNSASAQQLETLPGIGPVLAERIINTRSQQGPFRSVADLQRVPGIGPKRAAELSQYIGSQ